MLNLLRCFLIFVVGLVVFGWSLVAGQTPSPHPGPFELAFEPPVSQPEFGAHPLAFMDPASPLAVHRPRFAVSSPHLAAWRLKLDSVEPVEPKPDLLARARPLAAAELKIIAADASAASHIVALTPKSSTGINLKFLSQRIADHNLSVQAIEDQLRRRQQWDLAALESITSQMEDVLRAKELWVLYYRVLDSGHQRALGSIASLTSGVELLRQRLFETHVAAEVDHATVSGFGKEETKRRLSVLSDRTREWLELAE